MLWPHGGGPKARRPVLFCSCWSLVLFRTFCGVLNYLSSFLCTWLFEMENACCASRGLGFGRCRSRA